MKILIATHETQGQRKSDFSHVPDGEIVSPNGFECDGERVDGSCGCRRAFSSLGEASTATTTAAIEDRDISRDQLIEVVRDSRTRGGWAKGDDSDAGWFAEEADEIIRVGAKFPAGAVIERRGEKVIMRKDGGQA